MHEATEPSLVGMHATRYSRQLSLSAFVMTGCTMCVLLAKLEASCIRVRAIG